MILQSSIKKLLNREDLSSIACQQIMDEILDTNNTITNPLQIAAFLVLLRAKRETSDELAAIVNSLRAKMITVPIELPVLDIVGTGGDGLHSVNISTGSALVAASCGVKVAKHGNVSVSSQAGSADVLQALGLKIHQTPEQIKQSIEEIGIGFCFSPNFHPVAAAIRQLRRELNVPTTFNMLGPLLNPAHASHIVLGVYDPNLLSLMAEVLVKTGHRSAFVVHSMGLDEVSSAGPAHILEVREQVKQVFILDPSSLGLERCELTDLRGGDANINARLLKIAFSGKQSAIADTLALNAALALTLYGTHTNLRHALAHARENLASGAVMTLLKDWITFTRDQHHE